MGFGVQSQGEDQALGMLSHRSRADRTLWRILTLVAALGVAAVLPVASAFAQGWWPWSQEQPRRPPPVPREPVYRPDAPPPPGYAAPPGAAQRGVSNICLQLEQRLVAETQGTGQQAQMLPQIEAQIRQADQQFRAARAELDRRDCYDTFLFARSLRQSPMCVRIANDMEAAKRRLADLDSQRQQIVGSRGRSYQDDIIRELARNGCGPQYTQEARRRDAANNPFSSLWQDDEDGPRPGGANEWNTLPFATYRTVCVRMCDGFYFPVSFSTLPNHFQRDADACQSRCAAPSELFYYQNPGGAMEQAVSARTQQPYSSLKTAFRYRKEFVQGCSCKQAEYSPQPADKKADAGGPSQTLAAAPGSPPQSLPPRLFGQAPRQP